MNTNTLPEKMQIIKCNFGEAFILEDGIAKIALKEDYEMKLSDLHEMNEVLFKLGNGKKLKVLFTAGLYTTYNQEAIKNSTNLEFYKYNLADAYVVKTLHQRLLATFYINIMKPPIPVKYFDTEEKALAWLKNI